MIHLAGVVFGGWWGDYVAVDGAVVNGTVINTASGGDDVTLLFISILYWHNALQAVLFLFV